MADLTLKIDADYQKASQAFKELANESEEVRKKIEKFSDSFKTEQIDKFIDKQKLTEIAMSGTKGEVAAMTAVQKNYENEIQNLIKRGLDPESDAIQRLRNEHDNLVKKIKETTEVQEKQKELLKGAEKAALGYFAALAAGVTAIGVATQKTAEAGDQFAKTARIIGMTAETFQELNYAAKMSGVDNLKGGLEKLNKTVADVRSDTGTLTGYLKENDTQLLNQLKNVNSNEEAFNLLMDAIGKAPNEFSRAELAQAAFGKSGQELILLANEGTDGISKLREEAKKYGVISNETAANSEAFLDAQARLKSALTGVTTELTGGLLPGLTDTITKIADFIAGIDNLEGILAGIKYALIGITAGLTAFLLVAKGSVILHGLATAFKAVTAAMAANPIGAVAVIITAVLIPALIALYKNWDTVQTYLLQGLARVQYAFNWLGSVIEEQLVIAFNAVKSAGASLLDFIIGNIVRGVGNMLEVMGKLPFVGDLFESAANKVNTLGNAIGNITEETRRSSRDAIQNARDKQNAVEDELKTTLASIDAEAKARRNAIEEQKKANKELTEDTQNELTKNTDGIESEVSSLIDRLNKIPLTENQILGEQLNQFQSFLKQRLDLERINGEERITWLQEQEKKLLEIETISGEEKIAATAAINELILEEQKKFKDKLLTERLNEIPLSDQAIQTEQMEQFTAFLNQQLELERLNGEERITWLQEQQAMLMELNTLNGDEKIALEKAVNDMILEEDRKLKKGQEELLNEKLKGLTDFYNGVGELASLGAKKNIGLLIIEKAAASASALINSYLAFNKTLASVPYPFNIPAAAGVLASGIAQQIKIVSTSIPSAETGGRFIVPDGVGSDSRLMRVNPGEEVDVTPRGQVGNNQTQNIIVQIEKDTIFNVVNEGIASGDILIMAGNY
jgi:hypothetical protein